MSSKYKVAEDTVPHFVTFTVISWIDIFIRELYKEIPVSSLKYCTESKATDLKRWLKKSREIQWDYKNIVKRKGQLERFNPNFAIAKSGLK
jgi:hypothetical protein